MLLRDGLKREKGLFDLLSWEMLVGDGLLRNADKALAATLEYRGPDLDSATAAELTALSRTMESAVDLLGDGWMLHAEAQRLPAPPYPAADHFPDGVTRAIDETRREAYAADRARFRTRYYLTLTHKPRSRLRTRRSLVGPRRQAKDVLEAELQRQGEFEEQVDEVRRLLATRLTVRRLNSREMVRYLYTALTCRDHPVQVPRHPITLEALFGAGELHGGTELRFAETHIVPVTIVNYPESAHPTLLAGLDELPFPYRAVFRYIVLDRHTAKTAIAKVRRQWATAGLSAREFFAFLVGGSQAEPRYRDRHAPRMADDADDALDELDRDETSAGYLTATLLTFDTDRARAEEQAAEIVKQLRNAGFVAFTETYNAVEAYLGSLPAHGYYDCRRPLVTHRAFVDLAPTTAVWSGQPDNPHPALAGQGPCIVAATEGSTPFFWSLASNDVQHTLIAGPIGSGKSTLVNLIMAQYLRYRDAQVISFDKGWSQYVLCRAAGGCHYAPAPDRPDTDRFAPLAHVDDPVERSQAAEWVEDLLRLQGVEVGPRERAAVQRALELLAGGTRRTMAAFAAKVQDTALRTALAPYVGDGAFAHLFSGERSALREGFLHVIEMEELLPLKEKVLTPLVTHLFREIERRLDGRPTLIIVEEAPNYLADTLFARRFRQWLLELRKKNAGVVFVTQLLTTFLDSDLRDAILENCPQRVFLPNPAATDPHAAEAYEAFGLSQRQIELVAGATGKRDYYLDTPEGSRMIQLGLSELELKVLGRSGPRVREKVERGLRERRKEGLDRLLGGE